MNTDTEYLKSIAEEIVNNSEKQVLIDNKANHHLVMEASRLEKAVIYQLNNIENFTQRDTFLFNTLSRLVNICDILYENAGAVNADVKVLLNLMSAIRKTVPSEVRPNLRLPKAFIETQKETFDTFWLHHHGLMTEHKVDDKLITIAAIPFNRFIEPKEKLYWGDFTWLKGYQAKLEIMDWDNADCASKTEALISLLIGRDFNHDRFYVYCKKYIEARTKTVSGKRSRLLEYAQCEKLVLEDTQIDTPSFDLRSNSVSARLLKFIKEEIDFVETYETEIPFVKLRFHLPGYKVAFLFKLLSEHKVFGDTPFKELANQIAATCLSIDGEEIPAKSTVARAYPNDQKTIVEFAALFDNIANYLRKFVAKK